MLTTFELHLMFFLTKNEPKHFVPFSMGGSLVFLFFLELLLVQRNSEIV